MKTEQAIERKIKELVAKREDLKAQYHNDAISKTDYLIQIERYHGTIDALYWALDKVVQGGNG